MIFLRTPITVYNYVFQENSQYCNHREQRLQAVSNRWANLSAFWGIFSLAWSCRQGQPPWCKVQEVPVGAGGGELAPALPQQPRMQPREQDWNVHWWNSNCNRASPIRPAFIVRNALWGWKRSGNTTDEVLASASTARAGYGKETQNSKFKRVDVLLFGSFYAKDRQTGSPGSCHAHPNHHSHSSFSIVVFQKKKPQNTQTSPSPVDNPSTHRASSAAITLTASHKIPSELDMISQMPVKPKLKVLTYTFVPIFISPHNISFSFHCFVYFLIKDFDILKPFYIAYPGNIQRRTTQMGK